MISEWKFVTITLCGFVLFFVGLFLISVTVNRISCQLQWENSGMKSRYTIMSGCVIQPPSGQWIPADNYREITP